MNFLVLEQDLRVSGTSQGIISRSFLAKLRVAYPQSKIDLIYLKQYDSSDQLELLPVDSIQEIIIDLKIPFFINFINKIYWRLFHFSLKTNYINKLYAFHIKKVDYSKYDHIFVRSAGLNHETILATKDLPILKKAIVNFHDPYPLFWYAGSTSELTNLELFKLKEMFKVVSQAKSCMSSASLMSEDMQSLYGCRKKFYTLPHQYEESVFDLSDVSKVIKKTKKVMISYHGAIMFGRDIVTLLDVYQELLKNNILYTDNTEFIIRVKGIDLLKLQEKYSKTPNIKILETIDFSNSCNEQSNEADINILLENGPIYSNILVGKAPFLASINKPVLAISPERSEMRRIIYDEQFIASFNDKEEIKLKLENLIINRLNTDEPVNPFVYYFLNENFKVMLDKVLNA
jgi:hypothetical protein